MLSTWNEFPSSFRRELSGICSSRGSARGQATGWTGSPDTVGSLTHQAPHRRPEPHWGCREGSSM